MLTNMILFWTNTPSAMRFLIFGLLVLVVPTIAYECTVERYGAAQEEYCVFRNVTSLNSTDNSFNYPAGIDKPTHIAFEASKMKFLPASFWDEFGASLKVLRVEKCSLRSITITENMEGLFARDNYISRVNVPAANQHLVELDLSMNRLESIQNLTRFNKLKVLNLSVNEKVAADTVIDLTNFGKFTELRELYLADVGAFYLDNTRNIGLKSLEILDLSKNSLLPSDLDLSKLYSFSALKTLKLNDNSMAKFDYMELQGLKTLDTLYIDGNNFPCHYLDKMLEFMREKSIATPSERHSDCPSHQREADGICCKQEQTVPRPKPPPAREPEERDPASGTTEPTRVTDDAPKIDQVGDGDAGFPWWIPVIVIVILAAGIGIGIFLYKKRSRP